MVNETWWHQCDMVTSVWHGGISVAETTMTHPDSYQVHMYCNPLVGMTSQADCTIIAMAPCASPSAHATCVQSTSLYAADKDLVAKTSSNQLLLIDWLIDWFCHVYVCSSRSMCQLSQRSNERLQYHVCRLSDTFRNTKAACWAEILALRHSYSFTSTTVWWQGSCH